MKNQLWQKIIEKEKIIYPNNLEKSDQYNNFLKEFNKNYMNIRLFFDNLDLIKEKDNKLESIRKEIYKSKNKILYFKNIEWIDDLIILAQNIILNKHIRDLTKIYFEIKYGSELLNNLSKDLLLCRQLLNTLEYEQKNWKEALFETNNI